MRVFLLATVLLASCNYHCSKTAIAVPSGAAKFADVQTLLLQPYCLRCHSDAGGNKGGYNFETYDGVMEVVNAGNSAKSQLCEVLKDKSMPPRGAQPEVELVGMVCKWIDDGASL